MTTTGRPRRSHRKSRNGCLTCKARHIKCDESRPLCLNCVTGDLSCSYLTPKSSTLAAPARPRRSTSAPRSLTDPNISSTIGQSLLGNSPAVILKPPLSTPNSSHQSTPPTSSNDGHYFSASGSPPNSETPVSSTASWSHPPDYRPGSGVNMLHMELLHHMSRYTSREFLQATTEARESFDAAIDLAISAPFLMHQLLAIGALHLSTVRTDKEDFYRSQAAELQVQALSFFNNLPRDYHSENPTPVFLFSSFLGVHVMFDTLLFRPTDFTQFLDRFIGCLRLHRGVYTFAKGSWSSLSSSDIAPLIQTHEPGAEHISKQECSSLKALMYAADLGSTSIKACLDSIDRLQWVFDCASLGTTGGADVIFAWPITMSSEFTELLAQRRPEALAVLAHYGVMLHFRRDLWIIKDSGLYLIKSIIKYLGSYWEHWLEFPLSVLRKLHPDDIYSTHS